MEEETCRMIIVFKSSDSYTDRDSDADTDSDSGRGRVKQSEENIKVQSAFTPLLSLSVMSKSYHETIQTKQK
jgi:hypothetical protein